MSQFPVISSFGALPLGQDSDLHHRADRADPVDDNHLIDFLSDEFSLMSSPWWVLPSLVCSETWLSSCCGVVSFLRGIISSLPITIEDWQAATIFRHGVSYLHVSPTYSPHRIVRRGVQGRGRRNVLSNIAKTNASKSTSALGRTDERCKLTSGAWTVRFVCPSVPSPEARGILRQARAPGLHEDWG